MGLNPPFLERHTKETNIQTIFGLIWLGNWLSKLSYYFDISWPVRDSQQQCPNCPWFQAEVSSEFRYEIGRNLGKMQNLRNIKR